MILKELWQLGCCKYVPLLRIGIWFIISRTWIELLKWIFEFEINRCCEVRKLKQIFWGILAPDNMLQMLKPANKSQNLFSKCFTSICLIVKHAQVVNWKLYLKCHHILCILMRLHIWQHLYSFHISRIKISKISKFPKATVSFISRTTSI